MICKKCNFENDDAARFCENCGTRLAEIKTPVQENKNLKKIIWGCVALLYGLVIATFFETITWHGLQNEYVQHNTDYNRNKLHDFQYRILDPTLTSLVALSIGVIIMLILLLYFHKIKLPFGISTILLSAIAAISCFFSHYGVGSFIFVFFAAIMTVLVYKYSFAENKKLI
jgi:hypothetical protein